MKRLLKLGGILLLLLLVGLGILILSLGRVVKAGIERLGPAIVQVDVTVADASLSLFSGSGWLRGCAVGNPDGYVSRSAFEASLISIDLAPRTLLDDKVHIRSIQIDHPEITFEGVPGENNLTRLLENVDAFRERTGGNPGSSNQVARPDPGPRLQVDELRFTDGTLRIQTPFTGTEPILLDIEDLRLTDLGRDGQGITAGELVQRLLTELLGSTTNRVDDTFTKLGEQLLDAGRGAVTTNRFPTSLDSAPSRPALPPLPAPAPNRP